MATRMDGAGLGQSAPIVPARGAEAPLDARQAVFQRSLQPLLGKTMQGEVLSKLTDGSFLVKVAGTSARMQLPAGAQVGSQVPLTLVAVNPRPTFQLGTEKAGQPLALVYPEAAQDEADAEVDLRSLRNPLPAAGDDAATEAQARAGLPGTRTETARPLSPAALLLSKAPLTAAEDLPGFDPKAPAPALSDTARAIASVLTRAAAQPPSGQAGLVGKTPLLADGDPDTGKLSSKLHDTVGSSGLFYESHVAEWADGKRALPELMREPQMQLPRPAAGEAAARAGVDAAVSQLVNLQLQTQEQGRVTWQGEVWPGQKMEWDIVKEQAEGQPGQRGEDGQQASWRSGVRFNFPLLGAVSASVVLVGGRVHIQMQTGSEQAAEALRAHSAALELSLDAAGAPLSSLTIAPQPATGAD